MWEDTGAPGVNPRRHGDIMHRRAALFFSID